MPSKPTLELLRENITDTYFNLRVGMAAPSAAFPIVFYAYTLKMFGARQQDSISVPPRLTLTGADQATPR